MTIINSFGEKLSIGRRAHQVHTACGEVNGRHYHNFCQHAIIDRDKLAYSLACCSARDASVNHTVRSIGPFHRWRRRSSSEQVRPRTPVNADVCPLLEVQAFSRRSAESLGAKEELDVCRKEEAECHPAASTPFTPGMRKEAAPFAAHIFGCAGFMELLAPIGCSNLATPACTQMQE